MFYYHYDGLGSVVALSDSNGNIVEKYEYDVYGEVTIRDANDQILNTSDYNNPYMFTGRRYDNETCLYYYRTRYYSPRIGRFLQTDPLGYIDSMNSYGYVRNNPINSVDPRGLRTYDDCVNVYQKTLREIRIYVVECKRDFCSNLSPIDWDTGACIIACAKYSGWAFPVCWSTCSLSCAAAKGLCHVMCAKHGAQQERTAKEAFDRCWDKACLNP